MPGRLGGNNILHGMDPLQTVVAGTIRLNNGAAPTILKGTGFTASREGEGHHKITITNSGDLISVVIGLSLESLPVAGTNDVTYAILDQDLTTADTFEVKTYLIANADTAGDPVLDDVDLAELSFIAVVGHQV